MLNTLKPFMFVQPLATDKNGNFFQKNGKTFLQNGVRGNFILPPFLLFPFPFCNFSDTLFPTFLKLYNFEK